MPDASAPVVATAVTVVAAMVGTTAGDEECGKPVTAVKSLEQADAEDENISDVDAAPGEGGGTADSDVDEDWGGDWE